MKTILLLEDNSERMASFGRAVEKLGPDFTLKAWRDANTMIAECEAYFSRAALLALDHDLNPISPEAVDPGTGLDVARFLADYLPVCPELIHSSNTDRAWSIHK